MKMVVDKKKRNVIILSSILFLIALYLSGPTFTAPVLLKKLPVIETSFENITQYLSTKENQFLIKPNNQAQIIFADSVNPAKTEYSVLYLHGFSASQAEGDPVHKAFASRFGCNLYLARLHEHGLISDDPLLDMKPDLLYESAKEALVIANKLGKKVIVMGTSTGGTLALQLAANYPDKVAALILFSPNIKIKDKMAFLLSHPWGLQIARATFGGKYRKLNNSEEIQKYWYSTYRAEATVYLQQLLDITMKKSTFEKISQPIFTGYYYKDKQNQDQTVDVKAIITMMKKVSTPDSLKRSIAFANAGDHVIGSYLKTSAYQEVIDEAILFGVECLKLDK